MLSLRLQRIGKKHQPSYRIVVAEAKSKLNAPPVEDLGSFNPFTKVSTLKKERLSHWLKIGAKPTVTVHNLLVKEGVLNASKIQLKFKAKPKEVSAEAPAGESPAVTEEVPASEEATT